VLLFGLVQRSLRLVDRLLPAFTVLRLGGLSFARSLSRRFGSCSLARAALRSAALSAGREEGFFAFGRFDLRFGLPRPKIGGQLGVFAERSVGANRAPENDAGLCHGRRDNVRVVALLRRALAEEIAVCAPFARLDAEFNPAVSYCMPQRDCRLDDAPDLYAEPTFLIHHHGRSLPRAGVESHVEIARAIASGNTDRAA
jgi:hypothetical protein